MADVGIRELKAHLSEYVARAASGEVIRVTDRGVPTALLMPLPRGHEVDRGLAEGWVTRERAGRPRPAHPLPAAPGRSTSEVLAEDRDD